MRETVEPQIYLQDNNKKSRSKGPANKRKKLIRYIRNSTTKATKAKKVQTQEQNNKREVIELMTFYSITFNIMKCECELKLNMWRVESALRIEEGPAES